jgi:DNA-directed RNA polymerase specialized sigma24 family protein
VVEHKVASLIAAQKARVRDYRCRAGSLDERWPVPIPDLDDSPPVLDDPDYVNAVIAAARCDEDRLALRLDLDRAVGSLPERLRAICINLLTFKPAEIARARGTSRNTIHNAMRRIRAHFIRAGIVIHQAEEDTNRSAPVGNRREPSIAAGGVQ